MDKGKCISCGSCISDSEPHVINESNLYCWECGYIKGFIKEERYLELCGVSLDNLHASVRDGKVVIWCGKTPPWEINENKKERKSLKYKNWRKAVLERDEFTCQKCGKKGGNLNAHHKKAFSIFKDLRYEVSNGITVCLQCHKEIHSR